jgi:hypothetical protein
MTKRKPPHLSPSDERRLREIVRAEVRPIELKIDRLLRKVVEKKEQKQTNG